MAMSKYIYCPLCGAELEEREAYGQVRRACPACSFVHFTDPKVAVIGSGPAGLTCAFDLARKGYKVTVFEKHKKLGGMLAVGLPGYRCPREEVRRDLAYIRKTGVEFRPDMELGVDFEIEELLDKLGIPDPRELMRKKEAIYKEAGLDDEYLSRSDLIDAMAQCPSIVERPIVVQGDRAVIGRPPENVLDLIK